MLFEKYCFLLLDLCGLFDQTGCPLQLPLSDLLNVDLKSKNPISKGEYFITNKNRPHRGPVWYA